MSRDLNPTTPDPDQKNPAREDQPVPGLDSEVTSQEAADTRLNQRIKDVLATTPGGEKLDRYFGISSGVPEQPAEEAARSQELVDGLKKAASPDDFSALLGQIADHAAGSGADPDALRALMRRGSKRNRKEEGQASGD